MSHGLRSLSPQTKGTIPATSITFDGRRGHGCPLAYSFIPGSCWPRSRHWTLLTPVQTHVVGLAYLAIAPPTPAQLIVDAGAPCEPPGALATCVCCFRGHYCWPWLNEQCLPDTACLSGTVGPPPMGCSPAREPPPPAEPTPRLGEQGVRLVPSALVGLLVTRWPAAIFIRH